MRNEIPWWGWALNISVKILLSCIAYYFFTIGDMLLAGLFMGWIVTEVLTIIVMFVSIIYSIIRR